MQISLAARAAASGGRCDFVSCAVVNRAGCMGAGGYSIDVAILIATTNQLATADMTVATTGTSCGVRADGRVVRAAPALNGL